MVRKERGECMVFGSTLGSYSVSFTASLKYYLLYDETWKSGKIVYTSLLITMGPHLKSTKSNRRHSPPDRPCCGERRRGTL